MLVGVGCMKMNMAENIAGSGLNFNHLLRLFKRGGEDSLRSTLMAPNVNQKPRVTASKAVLDTLIPKLCDNFSR